MASLEEIYVSREGIKSTSKDIQLEELQEIYEFSATYIPEIWDKNLLTY